MPSGATFTAPSGGSIASGSISRVLTPPVADSHLALLEVQGRDAAAAVAAGWAAFRPEPPRPLTGREERHIYIYETSPPGPPIYETSPPGPRRPDPGRCAANGASLGVAFAASSAEGLPAKEWIGK